MKHILRLALSWLLVALCAGCGSLRLPDLPWQKKTPDSASQQPADDKTRELSPSPTLAPAEPILRPGVAVDVKVIVSGMTEVDAHKLRVSDAGEIELPLLQRVRVQGWTLDTLQDNLQARYSKYFVDPLVMAAFTQNGNTEDVSPWGYVTVMGRVNDPGRIAIPSSRDLTVSKAVLAAGGLASSARDRAVRINRRMPDGSVKRLVVDLRAMMSGEKKARDPVLKSGDVLYVPESLF